jgi:hypothetical protein
MVGRASRNAFPDPEHSRFERSPLGSDVNLTESEVVGEARRLLEAGEPVHTVGVVSLRRDVETGLAGLRRGEGVDGEVFFARLLTRRPGSRRRA